MTEEGGVMVDPHVLEHTHRDDAVEGSRYLPVILERELHRRLETLLTGAGLRNGELLGAERDTFDLAARIGSHP